MRRVFGAAALSVMSSVALIPQQQASADWVPVLQLRGVSSTPRGAGSIVTSDWRLLKDGEPLAVRIWTGSNLCTLGIGKDDRSVEDPEHRNIWTATGEYLGEQNGRHQMRIAARFLRLGGRESSAVTAQTLSLREGDSVTLDAVTAPADDRCKVHMVTIDARLVMQPTDPALAEARYTADLWLVHHGPLNAELRARLTLNLDGAALVPFQFRKLTFTVPQVDPRQGNVAAVIRVAGSLRARTRGDGLVDVDVDTSRFMYTLNNPEGGSPLPGMLRKALTLKPDETTAIDFPPPASGVMSVPLDRASGSASAAVSGAGAQSPGAVVPSSAQSAGVVVKDGRLLINTAEFFKGHRTQMLITLHRLEQEGR